MPEDRNIPMPLNSNICPGDIVAFRYPYREGISPYARPSLVLEATEDELLLGYCTTSRERANSGLEIHVTAEFADCGLSRPSRFVLARRVRVTRTDPRFEANAEGTPILGRLTGDLVQRQGNLMQLIRSSWGSEAGRLQAERRGIMPARGQRRRRNGLLVSNL